MIRAWAIEDVPIIGEGDDLGGLVAPHVEDGDIVVVASTVVSKAEGHRVDLTEISPGETARRLAGPLGKDPRVVQVALEESRDVLVESPILLVETHYGHVCICAGVDESNVEGDQVLILPSDPDESARRIRERIQEIAGVEVGVIVTDTNGRAFKIGQTGVAIGVSGIKAILDWRGQPDLHGKKLDITEEAVADEIAGMANLLMGEGDAGKPIVIARGLGHLMGSGSAKDLQRPLEEDVIRKALKK